MLVVVAFTVVVAVLLLDIYSMVVVIVLATSIIMWTAEVVAVSIAPVVVLNSRYHVIISTRVEYSRVQ